MERIPIPIYWVGSSRKELLAFPEDARQDAGYQLHRLQCGEMPQDWKVLADLGRGVGGVYEIRLWQGEATFRIAYATKYSGHITVFHCWQKTTRTTTKTTKVLIVRRYKKL